jgi:superoxide dismutase, Cu-Zn family
MRRLFSIESVAGAGRLQLKERHMRRMVLVAAVLIASARAAVADPVTVDMKAVTADGIGASVGNITLTETPKGLLLGISLTNVPAGPHGFHLHEKADCGAGDVNGKKAAAGAAGKHFDPDATGKHAGPTGEGHKGDLPLLEVTAPEAGKPFTVELLAPRLTLADVKGRALMIHENGDNYADDPAPLGGGGARIACGAIGG